MHRGVALLLAAIACGGSPQAANVFSIDVAAAGGGPLLITAIGGTLQLSATPRDGAGHAVSGVGVLWTSSDPTVAIVDPNGLVTAVANGSADIKASGGGAAGRVTVTVAQAPGSVSVTPPATSVERGATAQFSAAIVDSGGHSVTGAAIAWTTGDASIATVSNAGLATGVAVGSTTVTATSAGKSSSATLSVTVPAAGSVAVSSAASGPLTSIDDTRQLAAAAADTRGAALPEAAFAWSSSDDSVVSVDAHGVATARKNGTATITATSGAAHGSLDVTVAQAVHSLDVAPATQSIAPDALFTFTGRPLDANGHPVASAPAASWSIDDPAVASIDAGTGQVHGNAAATALATTTVRAAIGLVHGSASLTIDPAMAPVVSVSLTQPSGALASFGDSVQLSATALNNAANPVPGVVFDWSSDHPAVATVDSSGLVLAKGNGSAVITASGGGKSATVTVTVQQVVASVTIAAPVTTTLTSIDETLQLSASANDARGNPVAGAPLTWSTSDAGIADVGNTGLVIATGNGASVTITAASGAFHDAVTLAVAQAVHAVNLSPPSDSVPPGSTIDFTAAAVDAKGHLVAGAPAATWRSSDAGVSVSGTGHAVVGAYSTAVVVTITATVSGVDGTAALTVDPALTPVDHVVVTGGGVSLASIGDSVQLSAQAQDAANNPLARTIAWSIQDGTSNVVTVDQSSGLVLARGNGTKTIVASAGGVSGTTTVTVAQVLASVAVATSVSGASTTLASLGDTLALAATGLDARGNPIAGGAFDWRSDSANATVDHLTGVVTAVSNGAANVFAKSGTIESAGFAVTVAQAVASITVSAGAASTTLLSLGDTLQLSAAAFDARANAVSVAGFTWSPTSGAAAIVDQTGLVLAAANGETFVQASAGGKTGSLKISVEQAVASVSVSGASTLKSLGETAQLTAVASDARGNAISGVSFGWRSDATAFVTVGATGVIKAIANGSANVFAKASTVESAAFPVAVAQEVASIAVSGSSSVDIGATTQLSAAASDALGQPVAGATFAWSVQDGTSDVLTVLDGLVSGKAAGQKTVVASAGGQSGTLLVTVVQVPVSVTVTGSTATLVSIGDSTTLTATALDANGVAIPGASFTWRSTDTAVATVTPAGVVAAAGNGVASIFAKTGNGIENATGYSVTVAQAVAQVAVTPASGAIALFYGTTAQFSAEAKDAGGTPVAGAAAASWDSSNTAVATIDPNGLATGHTLGTTTITATISGVSGTAQLSVSSY